MITRRTTYNSYVRYVKRNIKIITNKLSYYNSRLNVANNKLEIYTSTLERNSIEFYTIYKINVKDIDKESNKINYVNRVTMNNSAKHLVSELSSIDTSSGIHTLMLMKGMTENYYTIQKEIKNITRQLYLLNDKLDFFNRYKDISSNVFYYIISKCNKYYSDALLNGDTIQLGHHLGFIKVVPKKTKPKINWYESKQYKERLIQEGKVPYNKNDAIKAKNNGEEYNGVRWFIYYENETQHYINWYAYSHKLPNKDSYSFKPARYNHANKTISEIKDEIDTPKDLDNYKIGIVNKLNIALDVNEMQFIKYSTNDL